MPTRVLDQDEISRAIKRIAHEIVERNLPQLADTGFLGSAAAAATTPAPR